MLRHRHDPLSRRLLITILLIANIVVVREEYIEKGDLGCVNIACFFLAMLVIVCMRGKKQHAQ